MKLFCEKCKKVFEADKPESGEEVCCTECQEKVKFPESTTSPGAVIGDFLIEREISKGGMGEVYLARQLSLDRPVALKVLQAKYLHDKEYVESFFREARAAGRINHPHVVQAYAVGEESGVFYFAMEYIRGETMKEILQRDKVIEFQKAAKIIRDVASALDVAWRDEKLVHQDIKPDNIMLDANGFAKLADLGLARVAGVNDHHAEEGDEVLGTPQYISPEQLTGIPTDVRSDIYSLGATFYQFVTGQFPYVADSAEEIAKMHVEGKLTPPKQINPDLPEELNSIIMKMMARLIEERYQTPGPLIKALDMFLQNAGSANAAGAVPQLNLRGIKRPAPGSPLKSGGPASRPPIGGARPPFAGRPAAGPGAAGTAKSAAPGGFAKATPPPPVVPKNPAADPVPAASAPAAPTPAAPVATTEDGESGNAAAPAATLPTAAETPVATPAAPVPEKSQDDVLELKAVAKPVEKAPPPPEDPKKAGRKAKEPKKEKGGKPAKVRKESDGKAVKSLLKLLLVFVLLGFTILCLAAAFYFLAVGEKLPESMKERGENYIAWVNDHFKKSGGETETEPGEPVPDAPVTRVVYLAAMEKVLDMVRDNPADKTPVFAAADQFFRDYPAPVTDEEIAAFRRFKEIFDRWDETYRVGPAREQLRAQYMTEFSARMRQEEEARRAAADRDTAARQAAETAERRAREQEAADRAQREREEAEAQARLARINPELQKLFGNVGDGLLTAARTGNAAVFEQALSDLRLFPFEAGRSQTDMRIINQLNAFGSELPGEFQKMRAFMQKLETVNPNNGFTVELANGQLVTVTGIRPDRITAVDTNRRILNLDLSQDRIRDTLLRRLETRLELRQPALYFDLLTGDFTERTARAAAGQPFWGTWYPEFLKSYFYAILQRSSAAEREVLQARYGTLPEFQEAMKGY